MRNHEIGPDGRWLTFESNETYDLVLAIYPMGVQESLTAATPACNLGKYLTVLDGTARDVEATLADGAVHGQMKKVQASVVSGRTMTVDLSSAESTSLNLITFTVIGDWALLIWYDQDDDGDGYWKVLERNDEDGDLSTPAIT